MPSTARAAVTSARILWEGPCAYVLVSGGNGTYDSGETYEVMVYSTNSVVHVSAGKTKHADRAESTCRRLNAYPRQTRSAHGLL